MLPLNKAIYGLKQSNYLWNMIITGVLGALSVKTITGILGYTQLQTDKSVFVKHADRALHLLLLYVDDCIIAAPNESARQAIYSALDSEYKCNSLGPVKWLLGFEIRHSPARRTVTLDQSQFIGAVNHPALRARRPASARVPVRPCPSDRCI